MDLLTGKGPSKRREVFYFGGASLGAVRLDDIKFTVLPAALGLARRKGHDRHASPDQYSPGSVREVAVIRGESPNTSSPGYMNDFYAREFWRFVLVQQYVAKLALTAVDYPPMQDPASFNLDAVKKKVEEMIKNHPGQ